MRESYKETMESLDLIKESHPNLYRVWKMFLERRKQRMLHILRQCKTMINETDDLPDIDPIIMLILYHSFNQQT
tara:strand:- start:384 stop:605 length:222 start_codon:yes stop_codon:yes gene_type:complete